MNDKPTQSKGASSDRKARLAEQLRSNLQKRKAQTRARRTGDPDTRTDGLGASTEQRKD